MGTKSVIIRTHSRRIPKEKRYLTEVPIGPKLASLIDAIMADNEIRATHIPREEPYHTTAATRDIIKSMTPIVPELLTALIVIELPPLKTILAEEASDDFIELASLAKPAKILPRIRQLTKLVPELTNKAKMMVSVLREYKLYATVKPDSEPEGKDYIDEILDLFEGGPMVEAPREGAPPRVLYDKFPIEPNRGYHENCLIDALIHRFSVKIAASKGLKKETIINWFSGSEGTSLSRLHEFASRYHIPLRVYDCLGSELVELRHANAGGVSHGRPGIAIMAYANHAYVYSGALNAQLDLHKAQEHGMEHYFDTRAPESEELSSTEETAFTMFMKSCQSNFSYRSEGRVGPRSLRWIDREVLHRCSGWDGIGDPPMIDGEPAEACNCGRVCWDMNKAFYTAATLADPAGYIPVFTALDVVEEVTFPEEVVPFGSAGGETTYYYVSKECMSRWRESSIPHLKGRITNVIHGVEAHYLHKRGYLQLTDIVGQKTATYQTSVRSFLKTISDIDAATENSAVRKRFYLYNGLLGRSETRSHKVQMTVSEEDAALLQYVHKTATVDELDDGKNHITIPISAARYLYQNTRHLYDWVIARTNLLMMQLVDQIEEDFPNAVCLKVRVDAVCYDREITLRPEMRAIFKKDPILLDGIGCSLDYCDPGRLRSAIEGEVSEFVKSCISYVGAPGTGKTHTVQHEHSYDYAISMTNVCSRNLDHTTKDGKVINGETAHSLLRLYDPNGLRDVAQKLRGKVVWLDEFSMAQGYVWSALYSLGMRGLKGLILTGDPNQVSPVKEHLNYDSVLLKAIMDGAEELTIDHRNDEGIRRLRAVVRDGEPRKVRTFMMRLAATAARGADELSEEALLAHDLHLVFTNKARRAINQAVIASRGLVWSCQEDKKSRRVKGRAIGHKWSASEGLILRARRTKKASGIYTGATYTLTQEVTHASGVAVLRRKSYDVAKPDGAPFTIPVVDLAFFEPGYAITVHSCQGMTVKIPMVIHQISKMLWVGDGLLYTAVTRACTIDQLKFSMELPPCVAMLKEEGDVIPGSVLTLLGADDDYDSVGLSAGLEYVSRG